MTESPRRELGDSIAHLGTGRPCVVSDRVLAAGGTPLQSAEPDVWQYSEDGLHGVQQPDVQPPATGLGPFRTDEHGRYRFLTVFLSPYPTPTDGPVGRLLQATGRHPIATSMRVVSGPGSPRQLPEQADRLVCTDCWCCPRPISALSPSTWPLCWATHARVSLSLMAEEGVRSPRSYRHPYSRRALRWAGTDVVPSGAGSGRGAGGGPWARR
ncbi:hypothetical protein AB0945_17745 [Streptomyces sp. NPDC005474]|uniref:dioxygenase family protein n=1 Tax=Streptomyces sp. NPDC005474 TaxID=3154878 RepID=UPI0034570E2E